MARWWSGEFPSLKGMTYQRGHPMQICYCNAKHLRLYEALTVRVCYLTQKLPRYTSSNQCLLCEVCEFTGKIRCSSCCLVYIGFGCLSVVWKTLWHNVSHASRQHGGSRPLVQGRSQTTAVNCTALYYSGQCCTISACLKTYLIVFFTYWQICIRTNQIKCGVPQGSILGTQ